MTVPDHVTEEELHDYIDDRLSDRRRAEVAAYLSAHPAKAAEVEALRLQDDALRSLGASVLEEPVPQRLTAVLRSAGETIEHTPHVPPPSKAGHSFRLVEIAAALFIFVLGGAVGWAGHGQLQRGPSELDMILSESTFTFTALTSDQDDFWSFGPDQDEQFTTVAERIFKRPIGRPDLSEVGLNYTGARILPNSRRLVGYFIFQNEDGSRVSISVWPSELPPNPSINVRKSEDIQTRYWLGENLGYAVIGGVDDSILDKVTDRVFEYYQASSS